MSFSYSELESSVRENIETGSIENAVYQLARYIDYLERESQAINPNKLNKTQVTHDATTGVVRISVSLDYTESMTATGDFVVNVTPYLESF